MTVARALRAGTAGGAGAAQRGFTVVELVVVLAVAALLAALAAPRFFERSVFAERAWSDELGAALRYARAVAIGSGCAVRVTINAADYALAQQAVAGGRCDPTDTGWSTTVRLPDGQPAAGTAPAGVTAAPVATVVFDAAGRTNLAADQSFTVGPHTLTLRAGSGYVSQ